MEDERLRNFQASFGLLEQGMVANVGKGADVAFNFLQYLEHEPSWNIEERTEDDLFDVNAILSTDIATAPEIKTESSSPMEIPVSTTPDTTIVKTEPVHSISKFPGFPVASQKDTLLKILGVPNKSRVETQLKICLQLVNHKSQPITQFKNLIIPPNLYVATTQTPHPYTRNDPNALYLDAGVLCSSDHSKQVQRCFGCIQRERKLLQRKQKSQKKEGESTSVEEESKRILQLYCNSKVDFSCGEAIIPARITCYCRHHEEKQGFQIWIALRDCNQQTIASALSPPVLITDDHKSKGTKRAKSEPTNSQHSSTLSLETELPLIEKIIPAEGPITGGIEVSFLGKNFLPDSIGVFGPNEALKTNFWSKTALLCILPPSPYPGVVSVTLKNVSNSLQQEVTFTYKDDSDKLMMELALQLVGMKLTGKVADAKHVAETIVKNNKQTIGSTLLSDYTFFMHFGMHKDIEDIVVLCVSEILSQNFGFPVNLNLRNSRGQTLLMLATICGSHPLMRLLLSYKTNVSVKDNLGNTALHYAAMLGYSGIIRLLVEADPSCVNVQNNVHQVPYDIAKATSLSHFTLESLKSRENSRERIPEKFRNFPPNLTQHKIEDIEFTYLSDGSRESGTFKRTQTTSSKFTNYISNYWVLMLVVTLIVVGGIFVAEVPKQMYKAAPSPAKSRLDNPIPDGPLSPDMDSPVPSQLFSQSGVIISGYTLISFITLAILVYRYRHVWKIKTVLSIICGLFALFVAAQVAVYKFM